jgi:mRNA interferase RelE/StbE
MVRPYWCGLWRYRVGDYRLICDFRDGELVVLVLQIAHRSEADH